MKLNDLQQTPGCCAARRQDESFGLDHIDKGIAALAAAIRETRA